MACGHQFRAGDTMTDKELWTLYQAGKQTVGEIAAIAGKSPSTIKRRLRGIDIRWEQPRLDGRGGFVHLDVTYWGRNWGVLLALDDATCRPLYVAFVKHETVADYVKAVGTITSMGYAIRCAACSAPSHSTGSRCASSTCAQSSTATSRRAQGSRPP